MNEQLFDLVFNYDLKELLQLKDHLNDEQYSLALEARLLYDHSFEVFEELDRKVDKPLDI